MRNIYMIYNLMALSIIVVLSAMIVFIILKKFSRLKTIDVNTIAEEKEAQVKERILIERMKRKADTGKKFMLKVARPSGKKIKGFGAWMYQKIANLEKKYRRESVHKSKSFDVGFEQKMKQMVAEANSLFKQEKYSEAEKIYIEIISLDVQNKSAYEGLGKLYFAQKEFEQALQTFQYLLALIKKGSKKIKKKDKQGNDVETVSNRDEIKEAYLQLGRVYRELGQNDKAQIQFNDALAYNVNDPKTLDLLIETAIIMHDKIKAHDYYAKLKEVNPDNQKLLEIKKKISEL